MDSRTAAHALDHIASLLELHGENAFKTRAYRGAARAVLDLDADDLAPLLRSGELERTHGIGPATLAVLRDLIETGESRYLMQLSESTPEGLLDMLRVPGLGPAKIFQIHEGLGVDSVAELEAAARDGRLSSLKGFGAKTAEKILRGIEFLRATGTLSLYHRALAEGRRLLSSVREHPDVAAAELAGSLRRRREVIGDIDIVAATAADPAAVAASFARAPGVGQVTGAGTPDVCIRYVDGTRLDLHCVPPADFAVALWRATGSADHLERMTERAQTLGFRLAGDVLLDASGHRVPVPDETALYAALGLAFIPPELREGRGEVDAAARQALPVLLTLGDIRGVVHCHTSYSDGKATVEEMARAAAERGWSYLGISDHSRSAFYAGGLSPEAVVAQHEEIDRVNRQLADDGVALRLLKGIEADILPDGRLDYDAALLDRFDYVIGSVHSRFRMDERTMTDRVLTAMDDPHLTILGHPTGRLLLSREPYAIDMQAVIERAGETGVVIELNADPHRLDIDWRLLKDALEHDVMIEIGPDAHSPGGLDNVEFGVGVARKGWVTPADVLNAQPVAALLSRAARRRNGRPARAGSTPR